MPKLWDETIDAHRRQVRDAIMDSTTTLIADKGPLNVTMSDIARDVGIGRPTLYKYFSSIEEILRAWHDQQITRHLELLGDIAGRDEPATARLEAVLETYAKIQRRRSGPGAHPGGHDLGALLHHEADLAPAEDHLHELLQALIEQAGRDGEVRSDVAPGELATFCLHALSAAASLPSDAATSRLVALVLDGLRP